jgi:hypothetical protein
MAEFCRRCGEQMVCRCGQTESSYDWPCTHGGCLFECPRCEREKEEKKNATLR